MTTGSPSPSNLLHGYCNIPSSALSTERRRKLNLSSTFKHCTLDRTNVLGDGSGYGHSGCVNAVSWAEDGNLLLTGGDDRTVRLWRVDTSDLKQEYPYICRSVITTGHRANIFNVQMLPYSNRIVTCAGDQQIRVFDATTALEVRDAIETSFSARQAGVQIIRCHTQRVKKLVAEDSPDVFLSLGEDGTVRQHDLRTTHNCRERCPTPLLQVPHELSTLSMSPVTPYQFVVAGDSPYGYLYDRRHIGRVLREEWGAGFAVEEQLTNCVRRFGRPPRTPEESRNESSEHITGSRISPTNGHEVLLSYSSDKVYLFSTRDEPHSKDSLSSMATSLLPPNPDAKLVPEAASKERILAHIDSQPMEIGEPDDSDSRSETNEDSDDEEMNALLDLISPSSDKVEEYLSDVPVILPRNSYAGARNVETVKDVNFLGPSDEFAVSGSDDGNWFMWDKLTGRLQGIYEGDKSVVNVIEAHPHLPVVAVSGIDNTVKLYSPTTRNSEFSRMDNAEGIIEENKQRSGRRVIRYNFSTLLAQAAALENRGEGDSGAIPIQCPTQ